MKIDLIPAKRQTVWKWPAAANFVLGGAGSALYLIDSLFLRAMPAVFSQTDSSLRQMIAVVLVGIGFLSVSIEAGRPLRFGHALRRWTSTWISREMVFGLGFLASALLNLLLTAPLLHIAAVLAAAGFLVSQCFILYTARSVPAWNTVLMPPLFVVSSLHSGYGIFAVISAYPAKAGVSVPLIGILLNILNLAIWFIYIRISRKGEFERSVKSLERGMSMFVTTVLGHIFPIFLLTICFFINNYGAGMCYVLFVFAGLAMIAGSATQKTQILLRAGYEAEVWVRI